MITMTDDGGRLNSPMLAENRPNLTTRQKTALALSVPCEAHQVPAGTPCPQTELQACMARRGAALSNET
jgi:hypothetical protein